MKLNKAYFLFCLVFILPGLSFAQKTKNVAANDAILHLKTGATYIGTIRKETSHQIIFDLNDTLSMSIDKYLIKRRYGPDNSFVYPSGKYHDTHGYFWGMHFGLNALGLLSGVDDRESSHFEVLFGHRFNSKWSLAGGLAFEYNQAKVSGFTFDTRFASYFVHGRYYLTENKNRLFAYTRFGYGLPADDDTETQITEHTGGPNFQVGAGLHFASRKKAKLMLSLGYYNQKTEGTESFIDANGNEIFTQFDILISRLLFKIGFEIN